MSSPRTYRLPRHLEEAFFKAPLPETPPEAVRSPSLSVVVPTRNEADNVAPLLERLRASAEGMALEVIFVDDSSDATPQTVLAAAGHYPFPVRLIARPPERRNGLGKAVVEGICAASYDWVCVMDGDLQHPPEVIAQLLDRAFATGATLVAASRLSEGGSTEGLSFRRKLISYTLALASRLAFPKRLRQVSDPLTGFFVVRRDALRPEKLNPEGFKILLEILVRTPQLTVSEIPFSFGERFSGQSKANSREALLLFKQLLRLLWGSQQYLVRFGLVGAVGFLVNTLLLALFTEWGQLHYLLSAALATQGSSLWNFAGTELWVFADRPQASAKLGQRLALYLLLNNLALLLRSPLLVGLVHLHVNYLWANAVTLALVMLVRFGVSERLIWRQPAYVPPLTSAAATLPVERA